ncbi:MAG: class I adenylate-forming enzyme family protein, partial [Acidimicrobiia bacterium]
RSIVGGGAVWMPQLLERMAARWPHARNGLMVGLGMTETNGTGATAGMPGLLDAPGNLGGPPPAAELRVCVPGTDEQIDDGVDGEVQIRSASVFLEYLGDTTATAAALGSDRWYRTGDLGHVDDGLLYLGGRRTDLIIRGGENIYPAEIEDRLHEHPEIIDVVVVGVEHRTLGQEVKAIVVRSPASGLDAAAVQAWAAETLAPFKVPARVEFRERLPRNAAGKVMQRMLDSGEGLPYAED